MTFISDIRHAAGTILGLAIGDAMGAPFEGLPASHVPVRNFLPGGVSARKPGSTTDDTLQALALAESLAACRGFSPEDFIERLLWDFLAHREFYGPTSRAVLSRIMEGVPLSAAARIVDAERGGSRSNGSVMRGPPIGVFYAGPEVEACSLACSALTHRDPVAGACSAFVNRMVSDLCRGIPPGRAWGRALCRCREPAVVAILGNFRAYRPVAGLDALEATHAALSTFMGSSSFAGAITTAVSLGGDTDTVGAITGALAGAAWGVHTFPAEWLHGLSDCDRIWRAAIRLYEASLPR